MKKLFSSLMLLLSFIFCASCGNEQNNTIDGKKFMADSLNEILEPYNLTKIEDDLNLPTEYKGIKITWECNKDALADNGVVTQEETDVYALLTVKMTYNNEKYTKYIYVVIKGLGNASEDNNNIGNGDNNGNTGGSDDNNNTNDDITNGVNTYIYELFGEDVKVYSNGDTNPYNVNISSYGDDVDVIFYTPNYSVITDPYNHITTTTAKNEFYKNYTEAESVEDAYFRTKHNLMSGDITDQGHIPYQLNIKENNKYVKATNATYVLDTDGKYLAYIPNVVDTDNHIIFYKAAYTSLNDVAAYLLAFGEVPVNSNYDKNSGKGTAVSTWGKYGRVNKDKFSGNTSKYPYEPLLPGISGSYSPYTETDFGTLGGYINKNTITGTYYNQKVYNNGSSIDRGAARFVFCNLSHSKNINERYVFYTYNHYNDFQEYLNYDNGFGMRFGNETAGNQYCGNSKDYNASNKYPVTQYPSITELSINDIINLYN